MVVIAGHDGSVWAEENFAPGTQTELKNIIDNLKKNVDEFSTTGIRVAGEKYFSLGGETGKQVNAKKGQVFAVGVLTNQTFIFAVSKEDVPAGNFNVNVLKVADYLIQNKY
ncbi:Profilin-like protein [Leptotrombidium deliense]|uniref:Profilin n=1 Tax=Leptotrombidium deliense TaxID=299467 RepID=A0A443RZC2_9ACAR|nr:Profilin-like protein [Leptotrombidium deliense]